MSRCDECEKKKISMDRMATILSQQSNDWHKQRERIAELEAVIAEFIHVESEGGGVCQNCMGEGVDLIQSGRMVIKEICTSCNGTGRSEGGADDY